MDEGLPNLLSYEGHEGVEEAKSAVKDLSQDGGWGGGVGQVAEANLGDLDIPVAELVPDEVVDVLLGIAETEAVEGTGDVLDGALEAAQDPTVFDGERLGGRD